MRNKILSAVITLPLLVLLVGCDISGAIKRNDDRYAKPGALDLSLTGFYNHYQYKLLDRYNVTHQWIRISDCEYRKVESKKYDGKDRFFNVRDIYEEGNSTWQRFDETTGHYNFDNYVRAEYTVRAGKDESGKYIFKTEKGYNPICFESWWNTSHSITLFLRKQPLDDMKAGFTQWYPEGIWTTKTINNLTWHVQETPEDKFRSRPLNGVGGPFKTWLLPLADTGYTMAMELGASKESLQYPEAHARMQAMFKHLIESVGIKPISNPTSRERH